MESGAAILISAALGTIGWYVTVRNSRWVDRRQHTYRTIMRQQDDSKFDESLARIRLVLEKNDIPEPDNTLRDEDIQKIDYLLNHYEFLSAAIWCGDMDEKLLRSCEFSRVTKLFEKMEGYIQASRKFRGQPTMYENLENLAGRWKDGSNSKTRTVCEFLLWRPCRNLVSPIDRLEQFELRRNATRRA